MSEIDIVKETIAYLKFWLGVMVVSDISLIGWILSNASLASKIEVYSATLSIIIIGFFTFIVHKRIEFLISKLKEL